MSRSSSLPRGLSIDLAVSLSDPDAGADLCKQTLVSIQSPSPSPLFPLAVIVPISNTWGHSQLFLFGQYRPPFPSLPLLAAAILGPQPHVGAYRLKDRKQSQGHWGPVLLLAL